MPDLPALPAPIVTSPGPSQYTAPAGTRPVDDEDRWVADGFEAAHAAHLDDIAHVAAGLAELTYAEVFPRLRRVMDLVGSPR